MFSNNYTLCNCFFCAIISQLKLYKMKTFGLTFLLLISCFGIAFSQPIPDSAAYLGQTPPGSTRKIFNLAADPGYTAVEKIAISPDGKEIYYEETNGSWTSFRFKYYKYSNNLWHGPVNLFSGYYCLSQSPDGNFLYFENNSYKDSWISGKQDTTWDPPSRFLKNFNVHSLNYTSQGNYYLSSNLAGGLGQRDICRLVIVNSDTTLAGLGLPVNSSANEGGFYISPDESFMIVMSNRPGGFGSTDLYISYKKSDGSWTNPKNLGASVNTAGDDFGPYVTADKKYLFYESGYSGPSSIYWVRADGLIDSLKYTNYVPYLKTPVPNQTAVLGQMFNYTIPDTTFIDDDGNNTLTFTASLANGNPLPSWLSIDQVSAAFSGTPDSLQVLHLKLTATDTAGASASASFMISVMEPNAIESQARDKGIRIFPNPSDGRVTISSGMFKDKLAVIEIFDINGKIIQSYTFRNKISIDLTSRPKGVYVAKMLIGNEIFIGKICIMGG